MITVYFKNNDQMTVHRMTNTEYADFMEKLRMNVKVDSKILVHDFNEGEYNHGKIVTLIK